jgi:hypothetical protein
VALYISDPSLFFLSLGSSITKRKSDLRSLFSYILYIMTLLIPLLVIICFYLHNQQLKRKELITKKQNKNKNESQQEEN